MARILSSFERSLHALVILGLACASIACGDSPDPVVRMIQEDPRQVFRPGDLAAEEARFRWDFAEPRAISNIQLRGGASQPRVVDGALELTSDSEPWVRVVWDVDLDADAVHGIKTRLDGVERGDVRLYWSGSREPFDAERRLAPEAARAEGTATYLFEVSAHPRWRGRIGRLRLDVTASPEPVRLHEVEAIRRVARTEALSVLPETALKVEIDHDSRNALLGAPGSEIVRRARIPEAAELRFDYGVTESLTSAGSEYDFRVRVARQGEAPATVWGDVVRASTGGGVESGRWQSGRVDLSRYAGREVSVSLAVSDQNEFQPLEGIPVWANPEIVSRRARFDRPPNVVLISVDTLRADRLSSYGYDRPTSPNIDAWARRIGVLFENAVAQAPWTMPSHASMLTGLDPFQHGVNYDRPVPQRLNLLAEMLREAGYKTAAVTGGGYLSPEYGFNQGFDSYRYWPEAHRDIDGRSEIEDGVDRAIAFLEAHVDRSFFLFLHTFETHGPFRAQRSGCYSRLTGDDDPPEVAIGSEQVEPTARDGYKLRRVFDDAEIALGRSGRGISLVDSLYDSGVCAADRHLGRLLESIRSLGLESDTVVILTSDHGEMLGEHGVSGHHYLYDPNLLVPLVVAYPSELHGGRRIDRQVRSMDIVPTVLELIGLGPVDGLSGTSLVPLMTGRSSDHPAEAVSYAASTNYGISLRVGNEIKYVYNDSPWSAASGEERLFRLRDDPAESLDVSASDPARAALHQRTRALLQARPGLRLQIANRGSAALSGSLRGPAVQLFKLKSEGMPCECVTPEGGGAARFTAPPGIGYTLFFGDVPEGTLSVSVAGPTPEDGPGAGFTADVSPWETARPWIVRYDGERWGGGTASPSGTAHLRLWWTGGIPARGEALDIGEELRHQLEALGYIE